MEKKFSAILDKREGIFYCSIPELKLLSKSDNLNDAYLELEKMKEQYEKNSMTYEEYLLTDKLSPESRTEILKKVIIVAFFLLLSVGILTRMINGFIARMSQDSGQYLVTKTLKLMATMPPEEKEKKVQAFQVKIVKAQKALKDLQPFIEVSKPLLRDLQQSFDLKNQGSK